MAKADHKHIGVGAKGKGHGTGAMTELDDSILPANSVLSNRDKAQHSRERGLDSKTIMDEQFQDDEANQRFD